MRLDLLDPKGGEAKGKFDPILKAEVSRRKGGREKVEPIKRPCPCQGSCWSHEGETIISEGTECCSALWRGVEFYPPWEDARVELLNRDEPHLHLRIPYMTVNVKK